MRANWLRVGIAVIATALAFAACRNGGEPVGDIPGPSELSAEAIATTTIRVSWKAAASEEVTGYEVQRRENFQGEFQTIETSVAPSGGDRVVYFDTRVEPNTYYGYRVRAVSRFGARSSMTNIAGAKTAHIPGLLIQTTTVSPNPESADPDGYTAQIRGARDTMNVSLPVTAQRLVSPIARGTYSVA